jgi:hypothetical protein
MDASGGLSELGDVVLAAALRRTELKEARWHLEQLESLRVELERLENDERLADEESADLERVRSVAGPMLDRVRQLIEGAQEAAQVLDRLDQKRVTDAR